MKLLAAISFTASAIVLFSANSFGQGCSTWMAPHYSTYRNASNANGNVITTTVTVDGSASGACPLGCNCVGVVHTPRAYNVISTTGGWKAGTSGAWNSFISTQKNQSIAAQPGVLYTNTWQGK